MPDMIPDGAFNIFDLLEENQEQDSVSHPLKMEAGQVVFASIKNLVAIVEGHGYLCFVWTNEGEFTKKGKFKFNQEHTDFEPLLIDATTANAMIKVRNALNEKNQQDFDEKIAKNRDSFGKLVELCWDNVKPA